MGHFHMLFVNIVVVVADQGSFYHFTTRIKDRVVEWYGLDCNITQQKKE